jgi:hypothetical protein
VIKTKIEFCTWLFLNTVLVAALLHERIEKDFAAEVMIILG